MASEKRYYAVVSTGSNDASFPLDSLYSSEQEAVNDWLAQNRDFHGGIEEDGWAVIEFTSLKDLSFELRARLKKRDIAKDVAKSEAYHEKCAAKRDDKDAD